MPRSDEARIGDICASCRRITGFIDGMDFDHFRGDDRTVRAELYELVVIGEAAKSLSDATRSRFPAVPWRQISGMRDIVVHQYHGIMMDIVWETALQRIPALLKSIGQ